jgi:hypothetical protein
MLRAVAAGRAEIMLSSEPDLFVDGLSCCDQSAAYHLARQALIAPASNGKPGNRVRAMLTVARR